MSTHPPAATASSVPRYGIVDAVRGVAIIGVVLYHLSWDLGWYDAIPWSVPSGPWGKGFARLLALTFLFLVGVSFTLAHRRGFRAVAFWRREAKLLVFALVISVSTAVAFPESPVFFGILHAIALFSVLCIPLRRAPSLVLVALALLLVAVPVFYRSPSFDTPWLAWTGLAENSPKTVDLQPLFPRFSATVLGLVAGRLLLRERVRDIVAAWRLTSAPARWLRWCGRQSLWIYLIHQPVLYGIVYALAQLNGGLLPRILG